jgi:hypothetical protein
MSLRAWAQTSDSRRRICLSVWSHSKQALKPLWLEYVLPGLVQKTVLFFSFLLDSYNKQPVFTEFWYVKSTLTVPKTARSKALVCGRSPTEIVGSNSTGGIDVCLLWVLWVVRYRYLRRADHSSRGVLPTVVRRCVCSINLMNEESLAHCGWGGAAVAPKTNKKSTLIFVFNVD